MWTVLVPGNRVRKRKIWSGADNFAEGLPTLTHPYSPASEAYRALRTTLLHAQVDTPPKLISITSPGRREGKSTTCANLGVVLAQAGKSTLLLDCDLRSPALHKIFALRNQHGITDVMLGTAHLQEVWQEPLPGLQELKLITVGPVPPNPAELASSARLGELFDRARRDFDYVLVDTPPVGLVSDPLALAARTDGVLLVFDGRSTRKAAVQKSVQSLASVGANVLGTAMNNVRGAKGKERYHYPYP